MSATCPRAQILCAAVSVAAASPATPFQAIIVTFVTNACSLSLLEFLEFNEAISKLNLYMLPKKLTFTRVPMKRVESQFKLNTHFAFTSLSPWNGFV